MTINKNTRDNFQDDKNQTFNICMYLYIQISYSILCIAIASTMENKISYTKNGSSVSHLSLLYCHLLCYMQMTLSDSLPFNL